MLGKHFSTELRHQFPLFIKSDILPFNLQFSRATKVLGKLELEVWGTERITEFPDMLQTWTAYCPL